MPSYLFLIVCLNVAFSSFHTNSYIIEDTSTSYPSVVPGEFPLLVLQLWSKL